MFPKKGEKILVVVTIQGGGMGGKAYCMSLQKSYIFLNFS